MKMAVAEEKLESGQSGEPIWNPTKKTAVLAALVAAIGSFGLGTVLAWSAPALPDIKKGKYFGEISITETSLLASLALLGSLISAPVTGFSMSACGRKTTMLILALPFIVGWAMIAWAVNLPMMYLGRFITGFCGGATTVVVPAYISEIAEDKIRGTLATLMVLMLVAGVLFTFVVGTFMNYFWLSVVCGCIPIVLFTCLMFMPESPRYLLTKRKSQDASKALEWLRGATKKQQIEPELLNIEHSIKQAESESSNWRDLFSSSVMKPTGVCAALVFFQQCSGVNGVSFFAVDVFHSAGTELDANYASIIIGACQFLTVLVAPIVLVDRVGRKVLLVCSELIMIVSLIALGYYFYVKENNEDVAPEELSWLPLASLIAYIIGYNIGMGPLPWLVMSECLPNHVKGLGSSIVNCFYWILSFLSAQTFQDLAKILGWSGLYWISALICILGTVFIIVLLPETKGRSSDEIQKLFFTKIRSVKLETSTCPFEKEKGTDNAGFQP